jgi:hypothetical protein
MTFFGCPFPFRGITRVDDTRALQVDMRPTASIRQDRMAGLTDKVAVITGATSGIGAAAARLFA